MSVSFNIIQEPKSIYAVLCSGDTVSSWVHLNFFFFCNNFLWMQFYQQNFYTLLSSPQKVKVSLRQKPENQILICNFSMSTNCLNIVFIVTNNLLLLFPTSPLEVAASFRSTIPMVIAASVSPSSRKTVNVWISQKAAKLHLQTEAIKFIK